MRSTLPTFNEVWQRQFRSGFLKQMSQFGDDTKFLIGCSGGMDSMLLLFLMSALCPERIRVLYINHQLQKVSDDWAIFIAQQCELLQIECHIQAVDVLEGNVESQAREARYTAFKQHLKEQEILVLAHHQQDQAETFLLRLFSGTGVQGLTAMKVIDHRDEFSIWRPLLDISREQICQWVEQLKIPYVDDPTNLDTHYDRAWCRHELWHILQSRFPKMQQSITRTSYLMQDANEILNEVLAQDLDMCGTYDELDLERLTSLSTPRQRQLLSAWMRGQDTYRPSFDMVQRLQDEVIHAKQDAQSALHWNGFYYVRYQEVLYRLDKVKYLQNKDTESVPCMMTFQLHQQCDVLSGIFKIETAEMGLCFALLERELLLKPRAGGEKIHLYGRVGAWPLKKAIQDAQIFPWLRHTIQILTIDNVMLGVFTPKGFWLAQSQYCEVGGWQPKLISSL
ncbi:tRNA lysidine(34) synthetase TilS [Acinetobacter sp. 194]|uniref:tRNA lysidine(34) synthetase TilS n=1 Tax=Acinetobacter shaoyimingii TaxID=2715164 RepID=UPI00140E02A0|nr:tRNA lysidine(34) synthetase TilS [Acinetobacter shaoyimingii]NHB56423.1 tRNA lysidine(34) synthetase TilS [Acinetobacter shaoyimingii]